MARIKKATAKKAAPKKMGKRPAPKKQAPQEELAPVPTQQNPQPPMGTPPMGANGPMMRKGGKIKKAANGATMTTTTDKTTKKPDKYKNLGGEIGNPIFTDKEQTERRKKLNLPTSKAEEKAYYEKMRREGAKSGKTMKKAQGGTKFAALAPPFDKATYADKIAGATKNKAKSGKTIKKAQGGALEPSTARSQSTNQKIQSNVNKIAMKNTGNPRAGTAKSGGSMKKCKYGCK